METLQNRNAELLLALTSHDSEKYKWAFNKLSRFAYSLAWGFDLFASSPGLMNQAVETAMNRVVNKENYIKQSDSPWVYAKETIYNSLCNFARDHKVEEGELTDNDIKILHETDEDIANALTIPNEETGDFSGCGWQVLNITKKVTIVCNNCGYSKRITIPDGMPVEAQSCPACGCRQTETHIVKERKQDDDLYHTHEMIERLDRLVKYEWWWDTEKWARKIESARKRCKGTMPSLKGVGREAKLRFAECTNRLWGNYHRITILLNSIPRKAERARQIMRLYLAGFKQVEIARYLYGDDANEIKNKKSYVSEVIRGYREKWGWNDPDIYAARLILLTQHLAILYRNYVYYGKYSTKGLCNKVLNSIETKIYFAGLEEEHSTSLFGTCEWLWYRWYPSKARSFAERHFTEMLKKKGLWTRWLNRTF